MSNVKALSARRTRRKGGDRTTELLLPDELKELIDGALNSPYFQKKHQQVKQLLFPRVLGKRGGCEEGSKWQKNWLEKTGPVYCLGKLLGPVGVVVSNCNCSFCSSGMFRRKP